MNDAPSEALEVLRRPDAGLTDVLAALSTLDALAKPTRTIRLGIAANITVDLLADYLRRHAYLAGVRLEVIKGSYDDLLNDVAYFTELNVDQILIIPFFDNLRPSWESQLDGLTDEEQRSPLASWLAKLKIALDQANSTGRVTVAGGHAWNSYGSDAVRDVLRDFNSEIRGLANAHSNVYYLDTTQMVMHLGERIAFDPRFYYRGKAPYTPAFLDEFARRFTLGTRGFDTYFYKVLALDCDNTLWGGIVGEDGFAGIRLDPYDYPGNVYWGVQHQLRGLESNGILLCLCSKNNPADVTEVFDRHPHAVLRDKHFAAKKLNWDPKVANLRALANELNLGLDSFIFIDDSDFELEAVREQLPQVTVFQVPKKLTDYPALIRHVSSLCFPGQTSAESIGKTDQYRKLAVAANSAADFATHEDYLRSLGITVRVYRDAPEHTARIAELSQKSNQFNLTTRRYAPGEITALMERDDATVFSFEVSDRFGECGVTGIVIVDYASSNAEVESFLMSCRVIGRGVELAVWREVLKDARKHGKHYLIASYLPTPRNEQVKDFFDRLGLERLEEEIDGRRRYRAEVESVQLAENDWVELIDG